MLNSTNLYGHHSLRILYIRIDKIIPFIEPNWNVYCKKIWGCINLFAFCQNQYKLVNSLNICLFFVAHKSENTIANLN